MLDAADLRFFAAIATAPSLAAAARTLNVTAPAVSQRLAQLEQRLGLRLVERGARRLLLTSEGELLARRSGVVLDALSALADDLAARRGEIVGPLRVIAPFGFGRLHVAPVMAAFAAAHPKTSIELVLTDDPRGAIRNDRWDMLVHVGRLPDLDLVQRKLASNRRLVCAAPAYLERRGRPASPGDLVRHSCGVVREDQADAALWSFTGRMGETAAVRVEPVFASNDGEVVRDWALAGLGIVERSEWSIAADLRSGALVEVLGGWRLENADVVGLLNPRTVRAARIEAFVEQLARALSAPSWQDALIPSAPPS